MALLGASRLLDGVCLASNCEIGELGLEEFAHAVLQQQRLQLTPGFNQRILFSWDRQLRAAHGTTNEASHGRCADCLDHGVPLELVARKLLAGLRRDLLNRSYAHPVRDAVQQRGASADEDADGSKRCELGNLQSL